MKKSTPSYMASPITVRRSTIPAVTRAVSRSSSIRAPSAIVTLAPTSPENIMFNARNRYAPQMKDKCPVLLSLGSAADAKVDTVNTTVGPYLDTWISELASAEAELETVLSSIEKVVKSENVATWLLNFGGSLFGLATPESDAAAAQRETKDALRRVEGQITSLRGLRGRLSSTRVPSSRIASWASGSASVVAQEACPMFGTSQREMLRGWWDNKYDSYLATGDIKGWQTVCDLYQHRLDPITDGPGPGGHGYGTTMASGGWTDAAHILMRQPRRTDPHYVGYSTNDKNVWGITKLEDGCLPWEACPVDALSSPRPTVRQMKRDMATVMSLCSSSGYEAILSTVKSDMNTAKTKARRLETKLGRIGDLLDTDAIKTPIKGAIKTVVDGPARLTAMAAFAAIPGVGWLLSAIGGEIAVAIAVGQIYGGFTSAATKDERRAKKLRKTTIPNAKVSLVSGFRKWETIGLNKTRGYNRAYRAKVALEAWLTEWASLGALCDNIYPPRTSAQWQAIGVAADCDQPTKRFETLVPKWAGRDFRDFRDHAPGPGGGMGTGGGIPIVAGELGSYGGAVDALRLAAAGRPWWHYAAFAGVVYLGYKQYTQAGKKPKGRRAAAKRTRRRR